MEFARSLCSVRPALLVALVTVCLVAGASAEMLEPLSTNFLVLAQHARPIAEAEARYTVGSSDFCNGIECPSYHVDRSFTKLEGVERRVYPATKWISADVTAERHSDAVKKAMKKLQVYTNGANAEERQLNLSVPPARYRMMPAAGPALKNQMVASMFVPHKYQDKTPEPTEWGLRIEEQEPFVAYVAAYGGFATQGKIINATSKLSAELTAAGIPIERDFFYNYVYDPPFELDSRYKEILVVEVPKGTQHPKQQNIFDIEREPTVQTFRPVDVEETEMISHGKFLYDGEEFKNDEHARDEKDEEGLWVYGDGDELYVRDEVVDYEDRDYDLYYHDVLDEYEQWLEEHQGEILADDEDMENPMWPSSGFWWSSGDAEINEQEQAEKEAERLYEEEAERMYKEDVEEDENLLDYELDDFNEAWTMAEIDRMPSGEDPWNYGREYPMRPSSRFWWSVNTYDEEDDERMYDEDVEEDQDFNEAWTQAEIDRMPSDEEILYDEAWTQAEIDKMPSDEAAWSYNDYSDDNSAEQNVIETVSTFVVDMDMDIDIKYDEDNPMRPSEGFWWSGKGDVQQPEAGSDSSLASALMAGKTAIIDRMMELLSEMSFPGVDQQQKQQVHVSFPRKAYPLEEARARQQIDLSELVQQAEQEETNFNADLKITFEVVQEQPEVQLEVVQEQPETVQEQPEKKGVDERQHGEAKGSSGSLLSALLQIFKIRQ